MKDRPLRRRHGWMLVELVIVMTLISLVMASGLALLVGVRQTHRTVMMDAANARSLRRLAHDFRHDLQRATSVQPSTAPSGLAIVELLDDRIEYAVNGLGIERTVYHASGEVSRELFRLQGKPRITFSFSPGDPTAAISSVAHAHIVLDLSASRDASDPKRFEIRGSAPRVSPAEEGLDD